MRVLTRDFHSDSRSTVYKLFPIGDIHIGAAACDEDRLVNVVKRIEKDDLAYWYGMGDYCDFINMRDPRFSVGTLASWVTMEMMSDLAKAQRDRFLDIFRPIAHKCIGMIEGNHETSIHKFYERDIYSEIVSEIKESGKFPADHQLGLGFYGWSILRCYRKGHSNLFRINLHHGYVGGKLAGAKALEMQRWLWSHDADVVVFGHSHNTSIQIEQTEGINESGDLVLKKKYGVFAGSFLKTVNEDGASTYSEVKGYLPMPTSGVEIHIRPGGVDGADSHRSEPIRIITGMV